MQEVPLL